MRIAGSISRNYLFRDTAEVWTSGNLIAMNIGLDQPASIARRLVEPDRDDTVGSLVSGIRDELRDIERCVDFV